MADGEETARLLARTEVFADLEERELREVIQVAVPRRWERGEVIFREGDTGDTCYLLKSGAVLLTREHQDGRMIALAELRAGGMFGELAMFRGETRSATAEALEPTQAVALLAGDVQRLIRGNPDIASKLLAALAERVGRTTERLLQQSFQTVAGRVASALLAQCVARQAEGAAERDVLIRATQAEIAGLAGTSRESASRFLATLEREGVVTLGRGKVNVHEPRTTQELHPLTTRTRRRAGAWWSASSAGGGSRTSACSPRWPRCRASAFCPRSSAAAPIATEPCGSRRARRCRSRGSSRGWPPCST